MSPSVRPPRSGIGRRAALIGLGGVALTGCAPKALAPADRELLVAEGPHPTKRDPASAGKFYACMGVAERLIELDGRGGLKPGLASAWTVSADGREWRLTLRPGALFHDGTPVTAAPVIRALKRARARPGVSRLLPVEDISGQNGEVVIRLSRPSVLVGPILAHESMVIYAPASFNAEDEAVKVIGSGPYRVAAATEQEVQVERFAGWTGPAPRVNRARYLSAARAETRALLAESGQADVVYDLDWPSELRLKLRTDLQVLDIPSPRTTVLKVNAGHPFLSDVRARRALSLAVDRQGIAKGVFGKADRAATQLIAPSVPGWQVADLPPLRTDVPEARRLLAELGWRPGGDGILVRDGQRFSVTLRTYAVRTDQPIITAALQQQFREIGVDIVVMISSSADLVASHRDGSLQLAMFARNHLGVADPVGILIQDYARGGGDWGAMGWEDPAVIAALETLAAGTDEAQAAALRAQVVRTLQDQLPLIPLIFNTRTAAFNRRVTDVPLDPLELDYGLDQIGWRV